MSTQIFNLSEKNGFGGIFASIKELRVFAAIGCDPHRSPVARDDVNWLFVHISIIPHFLDMSMMISAPSAINPKITIAITRSQDTFISSNMVSLSVIVAPLLYIIDI